MEIVCKKCGVIDSPEIRQKGPHNTAYCKSCGAYIKHVGGMPDDDFVLYFGKYKLRNVKSMLSEPEERQYLQWVLDNVKTLKDKQISILKALL